MCFKFSVLAEILVSCNSLDVILDILISVPHFCNPNMYALHRAICPKETCNHPLHVADFQPAAEAASYMGVCHSVPAGLEGQDLPIEAEHLIL